MHSYFKKGLILAAFVGIFGAGSGIHAKAAELPVQTGNPAVNADGLLRQVQKTEDQASSIIIEETEKNGEFVVREQNGKYEDTGFVNISSDYIYVRSATSDDSDWTGKLYPGNAVTLKGPVGEWTAVQSGNITGFIRSEYLMDAGQAQQKIRQMEAEALKNGTEVTFSYGETKEEEAARLQAEAEQRAREEAERKQAQRQAVVDYACQFIGNPYVWGGSNPSTSFDCSGFVCWVINNCGNGWSVGRTTADGLMAYCDIIPAEEAQPGDLIFFQGTYATAGASHVGIYVGGGMMIHCGNPISYASVETSYWQSHFYCYGRIR